MQETAALPLVLTDAASGKTKAAPWRTPRRPLKIAGAGVLLLGGAYGMLSEQQFCTSSNAVVSAYVLDVRTPIEGTVSALPDAPGQAIDADGLLAHVENPLTDHQHLDNLRTLKETAGSSADADAAEAAAFSAQREGLMQRADSHAQAVAARLQLAVAEAQQTLGARQAAHAAAESELHRGRELHNAGIIAAADFDRLVAAEAITRDEQNAQAEAVNSLRAQLSAAGHGLMSEPGTNNDVAYSRQRADELTFKLAETNRSLAASRAQFKEASLAVMTEAKHNQQMQAADLRSPIRGEVWQVQAMNGEHLVLGAPVISMIDCAHQFLLVEIPQERMPDIAIGGQARIRLTGETEQRTGLVQAVSGDPQKEANHKFAAFPVQDPAMQLATVRVSLDAPKAGDAAVCSVGRTARVLLPTIPNNFVSRSVRTYF